MSTFRFVGNGHVTVMAVMEFPPCSHCGAPMKAEQIESAIFGQPVKHPDYPELIATAILNSRVDGRAWGCGAVPELGQLPLPSEQPERSGKTQVLVLFVTEEEKRLREEHKREQEAKKK